MTAKFPCIGANCHNDELYIYMKISNTFNYETVLLSSPPKPFYISNISFECIVFVFTVDGDWTDWTPWATCPVTCGGGIQNRSRSCSNPSPQYGGADCIGGDVEAQDCNIHFCPSKSNV